ncbi:putative P-type Zn(2+) transporter [Helianthus annuus]|nr:putative P-type Zn(2+) transporter [Helianthus annuus]KAJ0531020.1 putative P-type Zn(2+) transporter [Helianthus annuus]KAJ0697870.1 putative P-type Zn(2+) transporter [Helianthus annuus]KAJ0884937.1 putative zinc-exporting ATPase [Helianthus annuus]
MKENSSKKLEKTYFDVLGLCCSSEVPLIDKILRPIEGVHDVSVIVPSRTVIVIHDPLLVSPLQIVKALNQARLEANVRVKGDTNYRNKWPSPFAVACGALLLLSFLSYVFSPFKWLALGAVAIGIVPIVLKSFASLRNFRLDVNTLMLIAVAGSIFLNDYWEAGTIVFLFTTAEWLESRASHKATAVMSSLMNMAPQKAVLASNGEEVNASEVMVNTKLAVKAGDVIPIDGIVVQGTCEVDEKALTGESFPVSKQVDSTVWAGTINLNGYISINTTVLAEDSVVARMAKLVEQAQNNKCKTQRYIDECAKYYTPAVVVVAACLAVIPAAMKLHNLDNWYHLALVVLVSSCPCALILSTPVATYCALSKAATTGLLIKGAEYLETLSKVKIFAFDKTGTITRGEFSVSNFHSLRDDISLEKLLYWVSSVESMSSHPMAATLIEYAQSNSVKAQPDNVHEFENFPGEGICGKIEGKKIYVGNQKIAIRAGCNSTVLQSASKNMEGKSTGYIFLDSSLAGVFNLSDGCRTGAKEALKELKSMGIKTAMLTGDCQAAANHTQNELEGALEIMHAELLPQDKAKIIQDFQKLSPTAMVGDGINDAPALATADIGISMGISGSALATETGHVILMSNDIRKIPIAVRLARKTRRKIFENIFLAIITKAAIIALAIAGHPLVWAAVLADVGTCLVVILNSMLLLRATTVTKTANKHSGSSHDHKHCHSSHKHVKCSSRKSHKHESANCETKKGCCGHDDGGHKLTHSVPKTEDEGSCCAHDHVHVHVHEVKHCGHADEDVHSVTLAVQDIGNTHGCCAHTDDVVHEVKHEIQEHKNNGCCGHDHVHEVKHRGHDDEHVHEVKNSVQDIGSKHSCCAHKDDTVHEVKHRIQEHKNHGCFGHDHDHVHEVKHCGHDDEDVHVVNHSVQDIGNKHGCCAHNDDAVHEAKHEVLEHKNHGCCGHDDSCGDEVHEEKHTTHGCCDHATNELHKDFDIESQTRRTRSCEIVVKKKTDCCHDQTTHKKSLSNHEIHSDLNHDHHHHVKEYITEEELGKMVRHCCENHGLEKRHVSECCKSFRKECCGHRRFGVGFNGEGGLSEIVIENV